MIAPQSSFLPVGLDFPERPDAQPVGDMADCLHPRIVTYCFSAEGPDHGKPAGLWACEVCKLKFVPIAS